MRHRNGHRRPTGFLRGPLKYIPGVEALCPSACPRQDKVAMRQVCLILSHDEVSASLFSVLLYDSFDSGGIFDLPRTSEVDLIGALALQHLTSFRRRGDLESEGLDDRPDFTHLDRKSVV